METTEQGRFVIFTSPNGRDGWMPVKPDAVPEWVKDPDNMARLVEGDACMDPTSESGENWFMAMPEGDVASIVAAHLKREKRKAKKALH